MTAEHRARKGLVRRLFFWLVLAALVVACAPAPMAPTAQPTALATGIPPTAPSPATSTAASSGTPTPQSTDTPTRAPTLTKSPTSAPTERPAGPPTPQLSLGSEVSAVLIYHDGGKTKSKYLDPTFSQSAIELDIPAAISPASGLNATLIFFFQSNSEPTGVKVVESPGLEGVSATVEAGKATDGKGGSGTASDYKKYELTVELETARASTPGSDYAIDLRLLYENGFVPVKVTGAYPLPTTPTPTSTPRPAPPSAPAGIGPLEISANPEKGFQWSYLLYIPPKVSGTRMLVVPNNTGHRDDDYSVHVASARRTMWARIPWARRLGVPLLVPVFPRFNDDSDGTIASQYNGRGTLEKYWTDQYPRLAREDLQMVAMIDDAQDRLRKLGVDVDQKVLMEGYSASAMFVSRFAVLHPDRVRAAAFGGHGWTIAPSDSWQSLPLPYPYGTGDIEALTGVPFNLDEFRVVAIFAYMGDRDDNGWALPWYIGADQNPSDYYSRFKAMFGSSAREMADSANGIYQSLGCSAAFVVYKNQDHQSAYKHDTDVLGFLQKYR